MIKRGVTELITPGVALNDDILHARTNNFLAALWQGKAQWGISFLDVSTGEFLTSQGTVEYIDKLLQNFRPSEVLVPKKIKKECKELFGDGFHTFLLEDWVFQEDFAFETLTGHFKTNSLKGFGIEQLNEGIATSGAILYYLSETQHHKLEHISTLQRIAEEDYVWMDRFTIRNLELYHSQASNAVTLLDVIDKTLSPMGGRMLKRWLALPLKNGIKIKQRHEVVTYLLDHEDIHKKIQHQLKQIGDLERLISKVATGKINPREVVQLKNSMSAISPVKAIAIASENEALQRLGERLQNGELLSSRIKEMLTEEAPVQIQKGNVIAPGLFR